MTPGGRQCNHNNSIYGFFQSRIRDLVYYVVRTAPQSKPRPQTAPATLVVYLPVAASAIAQAHG